MLLGQEFRNGEKETREKKVIRIWQGEDIKEVSVETDVA